MKNSRRGSAGRSYLLPFFLSHKFRKLKSNVHDLVLSVSILSCGTSVALHLDHQLKGEIDGSSKKLAFRTRSIWVDVTLAF